MSDYIYRVRYDRPPLTTAAQESQIDLQTQIRELLRQLGATPVPLRQQASPLEKIEARAIDPTITDPIILPAGMIEVPVPANLTGPAVQNETLLLTAMNENELLVTVTDASLQTIQCDQIVRDLAVRLYEKGTGRKVASEEVEIEKVGVLTLSICQYCRSSIHGLPHRCSHCGRTFCLSHVTPSKHQCAVAASVPNTIEQTITAPNKCEAKRATIRTQPKIRVGKVPCG
jgi:hypothetical protein